LNGSFGRARAVLLMAALCAGFLVAGASPAHADAQCCGIAVPPGWNDSKMQSSRDLGQGARGITIDNLSADWMSVDWWANGRVVQHDLVPPRWGPGEKTAMGSVLLDATVTRWTGGVDGGSCWTGPEGCRIAGMYKVTAGTNFNNFVVVPDGPQNVRFTYEALLRNSRAYATDGEFFGLCNVNNCWKW